MNTMTIRILSDIWHFDWNKVNLSYTKVITLCEANDGNCEWSFRLYKMVNGDKVIIDEHRDVFTKEYTPTFLDVMNRFTLNFLKVLQEFSRQTTLGHVKVK
jgi:hypothetical protein